MTNVYDVIAKDCHANLVSQYPFNKIPDLAIQRLEKELFYLKSSPTLEDFGLFLEISKCAHTGKYPVVINGTTAGSYIVYLLGSGMPNPLPAHYFCPECGLFEPMSVVLVGADLTDKNCPACGHSLNKDGFSLPIESVWGVDGRTTPAFEYHIPDEFHPMLCVLLQHYYEDRVVLPWGVRDESAYHGYDSPLWQPVQRMGLVVLSVGKTATDYGKYQNFLATGEDCLCAAPWELQEAGLTMVYLGHQELLDHLLSLQRTTGVYATDLQLPDMQGLTWTDVCATTSVLSSDIGIMKLLNPASWSELMNAVVVGHNTYASAEGTDCGGTPKLADMLQKECFQKYPVFTREDFFDHLCTVGFERARAFEISEFIRNGRASNTRPAYQEKLKEYALPPNLETLSRNYSYIFPRAYAAVYMLNYLRLAKYLQHDRRTFCHIMFGQA